MENYSGLFFSDSDDVMRARTITTAEEDESGYSKKLRQEAQSIVRVNQHDTIRPAARIEPVRTVIDNILWGRSKLIGNLGFAIPGQRRCSLLH